VEKDDESVKGNGEMELDFNESPDAVESPSPGSSPKKKKKSTEVDSEDEA